MERSPVYPDPLADEGTQSFTYALLPHCGDWLSGGVLAEAEDLNQALLHRRISANGDAAWTPLSIDGLALGLGALKPAEDGAGLMLRTYEPGWETVGEVNLLEEPVGGADLCFKPFQIHNWRLAKETRR